MSLCQDYLRERGITDDTAQKYGLEFDDRVISKKINSRLGLGFPHGYNEVIWFPVHDGLGNITSWIARPLPTMANHPRFWCPSGSSGVPFIPKCVYNLPYGEPILITEGPVKTLACIQAGFSAIGINGVWGSAIKNSSGFYVIRADLQNALDWRGRKAYLAFDADFQVNPDVRQALVRLFFILSCSGAEVYQLTTWDLSRGKGIDDFLVNQFQTNGQCPPSDTVKSLLASAKAFVDIIQSTAHDLGLVCSELKKLKIPSPLRDQLVRQLAKNLGVSVDELRKLSPAKSQADFVDPDPWPQPVAGDVLLHDLSALIRKHVVIDDHSNVAGSLWTVLSFLGDVVDIMPLLLVNSPTKRCGKTRFLTLLSKLVRRPLPAVALTPATVFRSIEKWGPTLLIDEADNLFKDSKGNENQELRSVINSSHTRDFASVPRCVGDNHDVQKFSTWGPKVIGLTGRIPDTMLDRSIPIQMSRKRISEQVARLRETAPAVFDEIRSKIIRWVQDNANQIASCSPTLPKGINDRAADCWLPLLAIADTAGGDWPELARKAAVALCTEVDDSETFIVKLLRALKEDFIAQGETGPDGFQLTTDICDHLNQDKEAVWAGFKNGLTPEILAKHLRVHKLKSEQITLNGKQVRGFYWKKLESVCAPYV